MEINEDFVPSTIMGALRHIVESMSEEDKEWVRECDQPASIHQSVGRYIRNNWSLWSPDSPLKRDAVNTYGIAHADDISGLIFDWVWASIRGEEFDPTETTNRYQDHWAAFGMTPLEAGGWPPEDTTP